MKEAESTLFDHSEEPPDEAPEPLSRKSHENGHAHGTQTSWFKTLSHKVKGLLRLRPQTLKESLAEVIEEHNAAGETIDPEERLLLDNVLSFSDLNVGDVMTPRTDIVYIDKAASLEELQQMIVEKTHTRIPVCDGSLDDVLGFLHVKDLIPYLSNHKPFEVEDIARQVIFVPPAMKVTDLLVNMRISRVHMAMVVDEYGGTAGLVTMEDVVEEIVGEIWDEHDLQEGMPLIRMLKTGAIEASGRAEIEELEEVLGVSLKLEQEEGEPYDTVGGLLFALLGYIPVSGEIVSHPVGFEFEVIEADPRRIKRVRIRQQKKAAQT